MKYLRTSQLIDRVFTIEEIKLVPSHGSHDVEILGVLDSEPFRHTFAGGSHAGLEVLDYNEHLPIDVKLVKVGRRLSIQTP